MRFRIELNGLGDYNVLKFNTETKLFEQFQLCRSEAEARGFVQREHDRDAQQKAKEALMQQTTIIYEDPE